MPKSFLIHRSPNRHERKELPLEEDSEDSSEDLLAPGVRRGKDGNLPVPVVEGKKTRCGSSSGNETQDHHALSYKSHHRLTPESNVFEAIKSDHDYFVNEERDKFFNLSQLAEVTLAAEGCLGPHRPDLTQRINEARDWLLKNHGRSKGYKCGACGKKYSTSSNLARHKQTHRSLTDKKAKKCHLCSKVYVSMPAFSMHMRTHNQTCKCSTCGKSFSRPWLLQGHLRTHTGERPYLCSICPKAFADKSNLRAHVQTHSKNKPHSCQNCGKAFALKSYLYKHEESTCLQRNPQQILT